MRTSKCHSFCRQPFVVLCALVVSLAPTAALASRERAYHEGLEAYNRGDFDAAAQVFRGVLRIMPAEDSLYAPTLLSLALAQERRYDLSLARRDERPEIACEAADWYRQYLSTPASQTPAFAAPSREAETSNKRLHLVCARASAAAATAAPTAPTAPAAPAADTAAPEASAAEADLKPFENKVDLSSASASDSDSDSASAVDDSAFSLSSEVHDETTPAATSARHPALAVATSAGAVVFLGLGVALYLNASDRLEESARWVDRYGAATDAEAANTDYVRARSAYDEGKTRAYLSYGAMGLGAGLAATAIWAWWPVANAERPAMHLFPLRNGLGLATTF